MLSIMPHEPVSIRFDPIRKKEKIKYSPFAICKSDEVADMLLREVCVCIKTKKRKKGQGSVKYSNDFLSSLYFLLSFFLHLFSPFITSFSQYPKVFPPRCAPILAPNGIALSYPYFSDIPQTSICEQ